MVDTCAGVLLNSTCLHAEDDMDAMRDLVVELTYLDDPRRVERCQVCSCAWLAPMMTAACIDNSVCSAVIQAPLVQQT